jgi:acetoin utilization protein AcuA
MSLKDNTPQNILAIEPEGEFLEWATLETPGGPIYFRRRVPAGFMEKMSLAEGLGIFFRYDPERQKTNLIKITRMEYGNLVLAYTPENVVAGYICMHPIDPEERWQVLNEPGKPPRVYEFGAIEVSRKWRGVGLSKRILRAAFEGDSWLDDKILTSVEFSWHWDYEESGMTKYVYRNMLKKVLESADFNQMDTDEPNVMADSANMFMVRIGSKVPSEIQQKFFSLLRRHNIWGL